MKQKDIRYDGPQCPKSEDLSDTIDKELHRLIDLEYDAKKIVDLFMLALILAFIMFMVA